MSNTQSKTDAQTQTKTAAPSRPNEHGTISVQAHFRISDPATKKTIVEGRG